MKKLFVTILGLFLILSLTAQYSTIKYDPYKEIQPLNYNYQEKPKIPQWVMMVFIAGFTTFADAGGDALYDTGKKEGNRSKMIEGKALNASGIALLSMSPFIFKDIDRKKWIWFGVSNLLIRAGGFDLVYNGMSGLPYDHIGNTSLWDKGLQAFDPPGHAQLFARGMFIVGGIGITINEFKPKPYGTHSISYFPATDHKEPIHPGIIPACILFSTFVINEIFVDNAKDGAIVYTVGCSLSIISFAIGERKQRRWEKLNY